MLPLFWESIRARKDTMRKFLKYTPIREAFAIFLDTITIRAGTESIATVEGLYRVLASDIVASIDLPGENMSTRDGYAVRSKDTSASLNSSIFELLGEVQIGTPSMFRVERQECVFVSTGSVIPDGADAVIMIEYSNKSGKNVEFIKSVEKGENVTYRGSDIKRGAVVLQSGTFLYPQDLGILSALGIDSIQVRKKPRVSILSTGDELLNLGEKRNEGKIYDTNRVILSALVKEEGGIPIDLGIVSDDEDEIRRKLVEGLKTSDAVIASGGTSVGEKDLLPAVVGTLGKPGLLVHGIAMRPGSPIALASIEGKPILLTPGFSVSCIFGFYIFGRAMLRKILARRELNGVIIRATITEDIESNEMTRFVLVKLIHQGSNVEAEPVRPSGSNILSSLVRADGYLMLAPKSSIKKGQDVAIVITRPFSADFNLR